MLIKIGKAPDNDVVINDPHVSRYHAQLVRTENDTWIIEDLNSTNGTFVNGDQVMKNGLSQPTRFDWAINTSYHLEMY